MKAAVDRKGRLDSEDTWMMRCHMGRTNECVQMTRQSTSVDAMLFVPGTATTENADGCRLTDDVSLGGDPAVSNVAKVNA